MRYVIEAGGPFTGPDNAENVGVYLTEYERGTKEPDITTVLQLATLGAVGSKVISPKDGEKIFHAVEGEPTKSPFPVPERLTSLVRFILGKHFNGFIDSYNGAFKGRLVEEGVKGIIGEEQRKLYNEYQWAVDHINSRSRLLPTHVTNRGFVLDAPDLQNGRVPRLRAPYKLESIGLYDKGAMSLTEEQRRFVLSKDMRYIGRYVPLGVSANYEPVVTSPPVPTVGVRKNGQYVPQVVMHDSGPQDWEYISSAQ
jgi:hypothetical protein